MQYKALDHIVHGGDYNPDQWIRNKEIWQEDVRLMKLAHVNSVTLGIFSWSLLEPRENEYHFEWLDEVMDLMHKNGIGVILATPSGARPAWMAQKYPEVLRVEESGIRNEYGVRHNHCLTSPVYREKVRKINRLLAERYKDHPALTMWHISNEYCGECHCELCRNAFREWLKERYHHDLEELNAQWWSGFWSHQVSDWSQISSPKSRGENHVTALTLSWRRFVSDSHISFYENEIAPLRELTPDIPITTNFMRLYDGIDYQKFASKLDLISWDNYPMWETGDNPATAAETAFVHDVFRSMKNGQPFFMMESTPSQVNWFDVNKLPRPSLQELTAVQAVAHGADSVQYFQWRKSRGSHEKYHGAVVGHAGHEHTRVFREVTHTGEVLEKLSSAVGTRCAKSRVAVLCDWENSWAVKYFCGFHNQHRDYFAECLKWYKPFWKKGVSVDIVSMDDDFEPYDLIIAPFLYMLKEGTEEKIGRYVKNGGHFVGTYLTGMVDPDDLCYLGGFPAGSLKEVFGVWHEETDALPETLDSKATFLGREYKIDYVCDIIHANGASVLGEYRDDFYQGMPSVTENAYGKGKAYYVAFRNDGALADDVCAYLCAELQIEAAAPIEPVDGVSVRKRGDLIFVMNFGDDEKTVCLTDSYVNVLVGETVSGDVSVAGCSYLVLRKP